MTREVILACEYDNCLLQKRNDDKNQIINRFGFHENLITLSKKTNQSLFITVVCCCVGTDIIMAELLSNLRTVKNLLGPAVSDNQVTNKTGFYITKTDSHPVRRFQQIVSLEKTEK